MLIKYYLFINITQLKNRRINLKNNYNQLNSNLHQLINKFLNKQKKFGYV